jgi:hypothetical protein
LFVPQIQRLFAQLQLTQRGAVTTSALTKSFGWTASETFAQQDVQVRDTVALQHKEPIRATQECMSVITEHLLNQCVGTPLAEYLGSEFNKGNLGDFLKCNNCNQARERAQDFRELTVGIRGQRTLEGAIASFLDTEDIDGVECGVCDSRYRHTKGLKIKVVPHLLAIQLKRFDLDWNTFQASCRTCCFPSFV